ncbi:MAG: hypothetical protein P8J61_07855 [Gammaproteobacteria bacterium]|nr:hypothetical protein [Gammaproteobacteria bacterium]
MMKILGYGLILFLTLGITLSQALLERIGMETDYLFIALGALVVSGLLVYRGLLLIIIALIICIAVNMPDMLIRYSLDRDILMVVLLLMVIFPIGVRGARKAQLN